MFSWIQKMQKNQRSNCQHPLDHRKSKRIPEEFWFCFIDYAKAFDCVGHNKLWKILQARLQQYMNCERPDVQAGFRQGRGTRDQIADIHWIIEKARELQKNIYFWYAKAFDCVDHNKLENSSREGNTRPCDLLPEKSVCRSRSNSQNWTWNNRLIPNS